MIGLALPILLVILHVGRIKLLGLGGGLHLTMDLWRLRDKLKITKFSKFDNKLVELNKKFCVSPQF